MSNFFSTCEFIWIDPKNFDSNKYCRNNIKGSVIEFDLEYPNELGELHSDYTLPPDKVKIKREILSNDKLRIADVYNVPFSNVKKLMRNFI